MLDRDVVCIVLQLTLDTVGLDIGPETDDRQAAYLVLRCCNRRARNKMLVLEPELCAKAVGQYGGSHAFLDEYMAEDTVTGTLMLPLVLEASLHGNLYPFTKMSWQLFHHNQQMQCLANAVKTDSEPLVELMRGRFQNNYLLSVVPFALERDDPGMLAFLARVTTGFADLPLAQFASARSSLDVLKWVVRWYPSTWSPSCLLRAAYFRRGENLDWMLSLPESQPFLFPALTTILSSYKATSEIKLICQVGLRRRRAASALTVPNAPFDANVDDCDFKSVSRHWVSKANWKDHRRTFIMALLNKSPAINFSLYCSTLN